jgi:CO/xanthine dehydrogenase FAD-binding subunit
MQQISVDDSGRLSIGAGVTLAALAEELRSKIPAVAQAIDEIASPQIRNVATVAGNLRQEKRCWFFRNGFNCYKRKGALAPCYAVLGDHRFYHAAIGGHRCQAVTPSDLATVLVALDASVTIRGPRGERVIPLEEMYTGPGETAVGEDEVLTGVTIPVEALGRRTAYRKLNLWQGDFAVASAAVSVRLDGNGRCAEARICLGAVAPVPWRAWATERALLGQVLSAATLRQLLDAELNARAHPLSRNVWKLDAVAGLAERAVEELTLVAKPAAVLAKPAVPATV